MICVDARELFSALLDGALAPPERASLDAHLEACPDCPRELERLRATVAMLQGLTRPRAPVGFVDRVLANARPEPWPWRLGRWLFVPLRVKLPVEAAAVALVAVAAVYLVHRVPEVGEVAREGGSGPARRFDVAPEPSQDPSKVAPPVAASPQVALARPAPGSPGASATSPPTAAPSPPASSPGGASSSSRARQAPPGAATGDATPLARPGAVADVSPPPSSQPSAPPTSIATSQPSAASPSSGSNSTLQLRSKAAPTTGARDEAGEAKESAPPALAARRDTTGTPSHQAPAGTGPGRGSSLGGPPSSPGPPPSAAPLARMLEKREAQPEVSGRLAATVPDPERELDLLVARLGGRRTGRRLDSLGPARVVVELEVPREALPELRAGLERIGRWTPGRESAGSAPPPSTGAPMPLIRVEVRLGD